MKKERKEKRNVKVIHKRNLITIFVIFTLPKKLNVLDESIIVQL